MFSQSTLQKACLITLLIATTVSAFVISGCGTTQQANFWMDPTYSATPMKKVLVVAMRQDQLKRRMWEDAVVAALDGKKLTSTVAVASYQLFPNDVPDTLAVRLKAKEEGIDGVLVIARIQRDALTNEVPGYTTSELITRYSTRWNAYKSWYEDVYHPGYTETETTVSVRTDLLVPQEDGKLVWSVTSQEVDPTSADQFRNSVAEAVVRQLQKERIIH
jgi:hypothetical protein